MSDQHPVVTRITVWARSVAADLAAAAVWQDPEPLLQLGAAEGTHRQPDTGWRDRRVVISPCEGQ